MSNTPIARLCEIDVGLEGGFVGTGICRNQRRKLCVVDSCVRSDTVVTEPCRCMLVSSLRTVVSPKLLSVPRVETSITRSAMMYSRKSNGGQYLGGLEKQA